jgi:uncharacterized protein
MYKRIENAHVNEDSDKDKLSLVKGNVNGNKDKVADLISRTKVEIQPAIYFLVGLKHEDWMRLLERPDLSPRTESIFMFMRDSYEVTLLLDERDWHAMRHAVGNVRVESDFRLITLDIELGWETVGYLDRITSIISEANISCGIVSSFTRDHLLVKQSNIEKLISVLGEHGATVK